MVAIVLQQTKLELPKFHEQLLHENLWNVLIDTTLLQGVPGLLLKYHLSFLFKEIN